MKTRTKQLLWMLVAYAGLALMSSMTHGASIKLIAEWTLKQGEYCEAFNAGGSLLKSSFDGLGQTCLVTLMQKDKTKGTATADTKNTIEACITNTLDLKSFLFYTHTGNPTGVSQCAYALYEVKKQGTTVPVNSALFLNNLAGPDFSVFSGGKKGFGAVQHTDTNAYAQTYDRKLKEQAKGSFGYASFYNGEPLLKVPRTDPYTGDTINNYFKPVGGTFKKTDKPKSQVGTHAMYFNNWRTNGLSLYDGDKERTVAGPFPVPGFTPDSSNTANQVYFRTKTVILQICTAATGKMQFRQYSVSTKGVKEGKTSEWFSTAPTGCHGKSLIFTNGDTNRTVSIISVTSLKRQQQAVSGMPTGWQDFDNANCFMDGNSDGSNTFLKLYKY